MTKQELRERWDYFDMVHGVTVRALATFEDGELDFRPRPGLRSPRELAFHIYEQEKTLAEAAREGHFNVEMANRPNPEAQASAAALAALARVADVVTFANARHKTAGQIFGSMSDADVNRIVESPLGPYPAWRYFQFAYDEHWHHRGQLYAYLRLLGKEPPMLYDYQAVEA